MIGEFLYRLQYKELETEAYKLQAPMLLHKL
ncbi:BnaC01g43790D [Brassica napus]|uniref:BnaC01g43790D protein n=1 Tax=Brassica napus TaxID=3708 RepID=A0A078IZX9_BRANA|nr:BnaC01g43790D [Brassica napus]